MGPEIVALIVVGSVIVGVGGPAAIIAKFKHSKSTKTNHSHEHDVEMTTIVEERPDGTKIVTTTHKGHMARSSAHEEEEVHQRNGSQAIENGVGEAIAALPSMATSVVTAGLTPGAGGDDDPASVVGTVVGAIGGSSVHDSDSDSTSLSSATARSLPRTSTAEQMRTAIMQARAEAQAKMQFAMQRAKAEQEARMQVFLEEQARRDAEQDAAHRAQMEAMQERLDELASRVSSSVDGDHSSVGSSHHVTPRHGVVRHDSLESASQLTEDALRAHNATYAAHAVAASVEDDESTVSSKSSRDTTTSKMKAALAAWKARAGVDEVEVPASIGDHSVFSDSDSDADVMDITPQSALRAHSAKHAKVKALNAGEGMQASDSATSLMALAGSGTLYTADLDVVMGDLGSPTPVVVDSMA